MVAPFFFLFLKKLTLTVFSTLLFSQSQCRAGFLPHEQVASFAQTHSLPLPLRPQQVAGTAPVGAADAIVFAEEFLCFGFFV